MTKPDSTAEDVYSNILEHYPFDSDLTLQVLKGHLLVEEILRDIFKMQLYQPNALNGSKGAKYDCHQIICLVEAMTPASQNIPWVWVSTKKLNNIRNELAHKLSPKGLNDKIADLIKHVIDNSPEISKMQKEATLPKENDLFFVIVSMCATLAALKSALKPYVPNIA